MSPASACSNRTLFASVGVVFMRPYIKKNIRASSMISSFVCFLFFHLVSFYILVFADRITLDGKGSTSDRVEPDDSYSSLR